MVRGTQGRPGIVARRGRAGRYGARLARRDFRSACGPRQEQPRGVAGNQLGQRPVRARRLFLRHAENPQSAVGAERTERRCHILFRRGALRRSGYGHRRGGAGERTGNRADDPDGISRGGLAAPRGTRRNAVSLLYEEVAMPKPEHIDRRRAALIAYDVCRRALTPSDATRRTAMRPVLYTTPVSRADGADVVMLPTDLSAETGVPPLTNAIEGTAEAGFPDEIAP